MGFERHCAAGAALVASLPPSRLAEHPKFRLRPFAQVLSLDIPALRSATRSLGRREAALLRNKTHHHEPKCNYFGETSNIARLGYVVARGVYVG